VAKPLISPAARADIIDIGDFIALDNPLRAASFAAEVEAKILEAGVRPGSFQKRDDPREGSRPARNGRYPIFVVEAVDEVRIVRVIRGSRDLPRPFRSWRRPFHIEARQGTGETAGNARGPAWRSGATGRFSGGMATERA